MQPLPPLSSLPAPAHELASTSMAWMDGLFDAGVGLLWNPPDGEGGGRSRHLVRESGWYALGLLARGSPADAERAARVLGAILDHQYDTPGTAWHGSFRRAPEEPAAREGAREWVHYDPNWRQFIGTTLAAVLRSYGGALPPALASRAEAAVARAVAGEPRDRVPARYSNIALMKAWLETELGRWRSDAALEARGEALAGEIVALFDECDAFEEYNSPTYYAIDLWALALWRRSGSEILREQGRRLEAALWRDVARFYHAGLRNLAGPWTRAYGMDMTRYVAGLGLWIAAGVGREHAPLPDLDAPFGHAHDLCMAPGVALLGPKVPADVLDDLRRFRKARRVERAIGRDPRRIATAWLGERFMIGAESHEHDLGRLDQYHPATVHWRTPDGAVGWIRLRHPGRVEARADEGELGLVLHESSWGADEPTRFAIGGCEPDATAIESHHWTLPGLAIDVGTDASLEATRSGAGGLELRYVRRSPGATRVALHIRADIRADIRTG